MRVLLLVGGDQKYGTSRMISNMIKAVKEMCPDVEYIVMTNNHGSINELCEQMHIENHVVPYRYCIYLPCTNQILDFFKKFIRRIQVVVSLRRACAKVSHVIDFSQIDIIHTNVYRDLFGSVLARHYNKPQILHLREIREFNNLSYLFPNSISYMNANTDCFIAVSKAVRDSWISEGIEGEKIHVIYDGIDSLSVPCRDKKQRDNVLRFAMTGYLSKSKGQMQLLKAIHELGREYNDRIHVDFYGDSKNEYLDELNEYVIEHNLSGAVRFLGYQKDVSQNLCKYDVGFNCSKCEGFGLVTLEYMLAGVCPIVSDRGANVELVTDGDTGLIYKYGDEKDLANKIRMLFQSPELLETISTNTRKRAEQFSIDTCVRKILELYQAVIEKCSNADVH